MVEILQEDNQILVCIKPVGVLSQPDPSGEEDMITLLNEHVNIKQEKSNINPIHRLDRNVGGVMVFAKKPYAAAQLSKAIQERTFHKEYYTVVHGCPVEKQGVYKDLLFKDSSKNKSFVVSRPRKGVKEASLEYQVIDTKESPIGIISLIKIRLHTGRTHQIRVQFSSRKMPLVGDGKYGSKDNGCEIALWSYKLEFLHPTKKEKVEFSQIPPASYPWNLFDIQI